MFRPVDLDVEYTQILDIMAALTDFIDGPDSVETPALWNIVNGIRASEASAVLRTRP